MGCKDIEIVKNEFVAKTEIISISNSNIKTWRGLACKLQALTIQAESKQLNQPLKLNIFQIRRKIILIRWTDNFHTKSVFSPAASVSISDMKMQIKNETFCSRVLGQFDSILLTYREEIWWKCNVNNHICFCWRIIKNIV